jgi:hypothetical protein
MGFNQYVKANIIEITPQKALKRLRQENREFRVQGMLDYIEKSCLKNK